MKDWIKENKEFVGAAVSQVVAFVSMLVRLYVPEVHHEISLAAIVLFQAIAIGALGLRATAKNMEHRITNNVDRRINSRINQFEAQLTQFEARLRK